MGPITWIAAGLVAFGLSQFMGRRWQRSLFLEAVVALIAAFAAGVAATALDFGGWSVIEVRAILLAFATAFAAVALVRRRSRQPE